MNEKKIYVKSLDLLGSTDEDRIAVVRCMMAVNAIRSAQRFFLSIPGTSDSIEDADRVTAFVIGVTWCAEAYKRFKNLDTRGYFDSLSEEADRHQLSILRSQETVQFFKNVLKRIRNKVGAHWDPQVTRRALADVKPEKDGYLIMTTTTGREIDSRLILGDNVICHFLGALMPIAELGPAMTKVARIQGQLSNVLQLAIAERIARDPDTYSLL